MKVFLSGFGYFEGGAGLGEEGTGVCVCPDLTVFINEGIDGFGEKVGGDVAVDEEVLDGVAYAGSAAFGGDRNFAGEVEVSFRIDVEVADALVVLDDGDATVFGDKSYEGLAASWNDAVDEFVELEQVVEGFAVGGGNEEDGVHGGIDELDGED
jgi:hypothetical protein